jgi:hypothetical protein
MSDITYDCIPCDRPSDDEMRQLHPRRPVAEPLGWKAQIWCDSGGRPCYERQTHGNYTDRWFRLVPATG